HRQIAETLEQVYGASGSEHAAEIAQHYDRSRTLPGAERGVVHALVAAERAATTAGHDEVVSLLRVALGLLAASDARRPRILARLGIALAWALHFNEAVSIAGDAAELIAEAEGSDAAADYLAEATDAVWGAGFSPLAWRLAEQAMRHMGTRRDAVWARVAAFDLVRR